MGQPPHRRARRDRPEPLNALVDVAIQRHVDPHQWKVEQAREAEERRGLREMATLGRAREEEE